MAKSRPRSSKGSAVDLTRDVVIHIAATQEKQTTSQVVKDQLGISWNQARGLCTNQRVMINGNLSADPARRLKQGEVLKVLAQAAAVPPQAADCKIYYLDPHIVVFEKPAGITSIRHAEERGWSKQRKQLQATLDELLPAAIEQQEGRGRGNYRHRQPPRVRMVHRLDRDTSGVMIAARTVSAEQALIAQFKVHSTARIYVAVCQGHVEEQTVRNHLVRDRGDGLRGSSADTAVGKLAITHLKPLEQGPGYSVVQCRLETGRTHQIRIHLAELGHPVLGEKMYLKRLGEPPFRDESGMPRHALHAAVLAFVHPVTGESMRFDSPLPRDIQNLLRKLRSTKQ